MYFIATETITRECVSGMPNPLLFSGLFIQHKYLGALKSMQSSSDCTQQTQANVNVTWYCNCLFTAHVLHRSVLVLQLPTSRLFLCVFPACGRPGSIHFCTSVFGPTQHLQCLEFRFLFIRKSEQSGLDAQWQLL